MGKMQPTECGSRTLGYLSLVFGLVATGTLLLAVSTDFWLYATEWKMFHGILTYKLSQTKSTNSQASSTKSNINSALRTFYYTFIYPYLTYCITLWGNSPKSHLNNLILSQKRSIRLIFNLKPDSHTKPFFLAKKILPVNFICLYYSALFVFKFINNLLPPHFINFYTLSNSVQSTTTRHTPLFYIYKTRLKLIQTSIKITGPKIWTELVPPHLRAIINLQHFKSKFRAFLLTLHLDSTT
ncbi:hypothetical protein HELRODRAFT_166387 [Helobdella robusta]|uniref:Uncharacterized protein n=1 Tax=Helobdella robusta TaxID=6412 RepID=T1EY28_HELRO|nr:hypothetical protein HELRODRAFT_166387 [Helobdella robusta]ESN90682.1 hypothetical protein HELRODRAFT_166387 [Helobdella robusta]